MTKRIKVVRNLLIWFHVVLMSGGVYAFVAEAQGLSDANKRLLLLSSVLLLIPVGASWFLIRKTNTLWLFLAEGAGISCLLFYATKFVYRNEQSMTAACLTGGFSILIFLTRGYVRIKKGRLKKAAQDMPIGSETVAEPEIWEIPTILDEPKALHWIWFVAEYVTGVVLKMPFLWHTVFYLFFSDVFLCFLCSYTGGVEKFIESHRRIANLPAGTMRKAGRMILGILLIFLFLFTVPSLLYGRDPLAEALESFEMDTGGLSPEEFMEEMQPEQPEMDMAELLGTPSGKGLPEWVENLFRVLMYILILAVGIFLLKGMYRAVRSAGEDFSREEEDEIRFLRQEKDKNENVVRGIRTKEGFLSPNRRIRRYYKKKIRRSVKTLPQGSETPEELESKAGFADTEETRLLHSTYEKARYSREGCSKEEADILKNSTDI